MPKWTKISVDEAQNMYGRLGYTIEKEIGSGGFKQVFQAYYQDNMVALKIMHFEPGDSDFRARREVNLMSEIQSPYVAKIIDFNFGAKDYEAYIAEEYISNTSLANKLIDLNFNETFHVVDNIFQALLECESRRIVHRDVKPNNILLRLNGDAVLTDFGLARPQDESTMTPWGVEIGTFPFSPPEFIRYDSQLIGSTSDLFSLGIIIYILLTKEHPFYDPTQIMPREEKMQKMLDGIAIPPHEKNPRINEKLSKFIMRLIERKVGNRYPSTERAYEMFKKILREMEI